MSGLSAYALPLVQAAFGTGVTVAGARLRVPGTLPIRLSTVAGNVRMHRLFDRLVPRGGTVVDVGANIGYNAVYAARLAGPGGRVVAVEPAPDNVALLRENVERTGCGHVAVHAVAAGARRETRELFLRGDVSAVNSLFPDSMYGVVTGVTRVPVVPLDDLVPGDADLVKIDVEGAELEVLAGMSRLLARPGLALIAEWHPRLQRAAGARIEELPETLLARGFTVTAVSHASTTPVSAAAIPRLAGRLLEAGRPVELVAVRRRAGAGV